jgi:DNA-binding winged helix-turn-helix (wHTH) protein
LAKRDRLLLVEETTGGVPKSFETVAKLVKPRGEGTLRFGECELDLTRRELRRAGEPCHLTPRAFALLELLVSERPRALPKADLRARLWPETYVSNTALAQLVTELRKAIGDEAREGRWIRTVFGYGYAFSGPAEEEGEERKDEPAVAIAALPPGPSRWLRWRQELLPLAEGANVVGRGREADVRIPVPEVSRRHARIVVEGARATVEDLESRNGTFVRGRAVHRPTPVADGDEIGFGPERTTFYSPSASTATRDVPKGRRRR